MCGGGFKLHPLCRCTVLKAPYDEGAVSALAGTEGEIFFTHTPVSAPVGHGGFRRAADYALTSPLRPLTGRRGREHPTILGNSEKVTGAPSAR